MFSFSLARAAVAVGASLIFCSVANAQQTLPAPEVAALLPRAREVNGLQLQITDAGWSSAEDLDISYSNAATSGFFFSYQVTGAKENLKPIAGSYLPVAFNGLFAPDGAPIGMPSAVNQTIFFTGVQPQWDHVRAEFEVRNPLASDEETGSITTRKEFDLIDLPALGQTKKPNEPIEFTTPNGTRLQLIEITRSAEDDSVSARWNMTLAQNSDIKAQLFCRGAFYPSGTETKRGIGSSTGPGERDGDYIVQTNVRAERESLGYIFDIIETSRAWRKAGAVELVSLDIPVNAIWKRAPLALRVPALSVATARDDDFEATWENIAWSEYNGLFSQVWLRDLTLLADGEHWTLKDVEVGDAGTPTQLWYSPQDRRNVFHTDNKPSVADESNTAFQMPLRLNLPERGDVKLNVQRARTLLTTHVLRDVPLPARDGILEFERGQFFDGNWHLRRVLLLEDEALRARLQYKEPAMILTFDVDAANYDAQSEIHQWGTRNFYDEKGALQFSDPTNFVKGDLMEAGHEKDRVMMILPLPAVGSKSFGGNFQTLQRVWGGPEKTLVLPDVSLHPVVKNSQGEN